MRRRSAHRRGLILAAAGGALALLVSACGGGGAGGAKSALVIGTTDSQVTSIDPAGSYDLPSSTLQYNIFQQLLRIPPGGNKPEPDLAQKCGFSDPKTYKCTLKTGQKFSNGDPVTAKDVKFSFDRNKKIDDPNAAWSIYDSSFKSVEAPDDSTVIFHLAVPDATWPVKLTYAAASIVDSKVFPADKKVDDSKVVGSGHYKLTKYQKNQQATLAVNPNYGGSDKAKVSNVIVQYFQKSSALKLAVEQGDVDVAYRNLAPTEFKALKGESGKGVKVVSGNGTEIRYLVFNVKRKPWDNKYVRQALAQTIDRDKINNNIYNGDFTPLYSPIPVGLDGHVDAFKDKYGAPDPAKAKALLKKSGQKAPLNIDLWYTPTHYGPATADEMNEIKRQLDASGVFKVTLKNTEWVQYQTDYKKLYGAFHLGWFPDYPDSDDYLAPFYFKGGFYENAYDNKQVNDLISKEQGEIDLQKRIPVMKQIEKITADDVPMLPLWQAKQQAAVRDGVNGVQSTFDPSYTFRFWVISKSA